MDPGSEERQTNATTTFYNTTILLGISYKGEKAVRLVSSTDIAFFNSLSMLSESQIGQ